MCGQCGAIRTSKYSVPLRPFIALPGYTHITRIEGKCAHEGRELRDQHSSSLRSETGSSLVEFALTLSLLMMMVCGILDCSRAVYIDHFLANTAREATRYAVVRGSSWKGIACTTILSASCTATSINVATYARSIVSNGIDPSNLIVTTTWPGTSPLGLSCLLAGSANSPGCVVVVSVTYPFSFLLPFLPITPLQLASTSRVTIIQ
jgi:Flp pilus assembly protein TadG